MEVFHYAKKLSVQEVQGSGPGFEKQLLDWLFPALAARYYWKLLKGM